MIKSWRHKGLQELFDHGRSAKVAPALHKRIAVRLNAIEVATAVRQLNRPGYNFHRLHGQPVRYTIHVNGPWCITFAWDGSGAVDVDLEQYH